MTEWFMVLMGVAGLAAILLLLDRRISRPVLREIVMTIYYSNGAGEELEQLARDYGKISVRGTLLLVDCGLTEQGLTAAQLLQRQCPWVAYCPREALEDYLNLTEDRI